MDEPGTSKKKKAPIDWDVVRRRLDASRAALERMGAADAEETKRILRARAQALAGEPGQADAAGESAEVVEFLLGRERYAVDSAHVREIFPLENLTPLPCTPAFVLGIVNLRGEILSVVDIRKFFDLPEPGLTDLNKVIVLRSQDMAFGILADAVVGVRRVPAADIRPPLPTLTGIRERYLKGVASASLAVLDAQKLLEDEKIIVREQVEG